MNSWDIKFALWRDTDKDHGVAYGQWEIDCSILEGTYSVGLFRNNIKNELKGIRKEVRQITSDWRYL